MKTYMSAPPPPNTHKHTCTGLPKRTQTYIHIDLHSQAMHPPTRAHNGINGLYYIYNNVRQNTCKQKKRASGHACAFTHIQKCTLKHKHTQMHIHIHTHLSMRKRGPLLKLPFVTWSVWNRFSSMNHHVYLLSIYYTHARARTH